jgi:hypothetical protein
LADTGLHVKHNYQYAKFEEESDLLQRISNKSESKYGKIQVLIKLQPHVNYGCH